jgi:hypothetical protein
MIVIHITTYKKVFGYYIKFSRQIRTQDKDIHKTGK